MLKLINDFQTKLDLNQKGLKALGLNQEALKMLSVGYCDDTPKELKGCFTFPVENDKQEPVGIIGYKKSKETSFYGDVSKGIFNSLALKIYKKVYIASFTDALNLISKGNLNSVTLFSNDLSAFNSIEEVVLIGYYDNLLIEALKEANITILLGESEKLKFKRKSTNEKFRHVNEDELIYSANKLKYHVRGMATISPNKFRVIIAVEKNKQFHTDRVDLISYRSKVTYARDLAMNLDLQPKQCEKDLLAILQYLDEYMKEIMHAHETKPVELTDEEIAQAKEFLKVNNLMQIIGADINSMGYSGEGKNKLLVYLIATSRKLNSTLSGMIRSGSSSGKTFMMDIISSLMPPEDVIYLSRLTSSSLYYMPNDGLKNKLLLIDETKGASEQVEYSIRSLQSRKKLTLAVVKRDITGKQKTQQFDVYGPIAYLDSSTSFDSNPENMTRCFIISLDESKKQTEAIFNAQRRKRTVAGLQRDHSTDETIKKHQNSQRVLRPLKVVIPFIDLIEFPSDKLEARRKFDMLLSLVEVSAFLHQYQRNIKQSNFEEYIEADVEDYRIAYQMVSEVLNTTFGDLDQFTTKLYEEIKVAVKKHAKMPVEEFEFTRKDVREWTDRPDYVLKKLMPQLENLEYLNRNKGGRGGRYTYTINLFTQVGNKQSLVEPDDLDLAFRSRFVTTK